MSVDRVRDRIYIESVGQAAIKRARLRRPGVVGWYEEGAWPETMLRSRPTGFADPNAAVEEMGVVESVGKECPPCPRCKVGDDRSGLDLANCPWLGLGTDDTRKC